MPRRRRVSSLAHDDCTVATAVTFRGVIQREVIRLEVNRAESSIVPEALARYALHRMAQTKRFCVCPMRIHRRRIGYPVQ